MKIAPLLAGLLLTVVPAVLSLTPALAENREMDVMSAPAVEMAPSHTLDAVGTREVTMNVYTVEAFEKAGNIVDQYISTKRAWKEDEYTIYLFEINPYIPVVTFLAFHIADSNPLGPGGGTSFFIEFDMNAMAVIRELAGQ